MISKKCCKCKLDLELINFNKNKSNKDGLQKLCNKCRKTHRVLKKEEKTKYDKAYHKKNKNKRSKYGAEWRAKSKNTVEFKCQKMHDGAKARSVRKGIPFDITVEYIKEIFPKDLKCPITGLPFEEGVGKPAPQSASLDKINPELGYIKGNVAVISYRANLIKQKENSSEIIRKVADWMDLMSNKIN